MHLTKQYSSCVGRSGDQDNISGNILKLTAPAVSGSLAKLLNICLQTGEIPWERKAASHPDSQRGRYGETRKLPSNLCPASCEQSYGKLVHQQLYSYLLEHTILSSAQSGFRPHHSTQDVLVSSVDKLETSTGQRQVSGGRDD